MALAANELPVSTRTRPSSVATAVTLAKAGTNATPSQISASPPRWLTGWNSVVATSPRQSRSARARTSVAIGHALPSVAAKIFVPGRKVVQRRQRYLGAGRPQSRGRERAGGDAYCGHPRLPRGRHVARAVAHVRRRSDADQHGRLLRTVHVGEALVRLQPHRRQARLHGDRVLGRDDDSPL